MSDLDQVYNSDPGPTLINKKIVKIGIIID